MTMVTAQVSSIMPYFVCRYLRHNHLNSHPANHVAPHQVQEAIAAPAAPSHGFLAYAFRMCFFRVAKCTYSLTVIYPVWLMC